MVSGGCLEADLATRAADVLAAGIPHVALYDARSPDDLVWGLGLGCEGLVEVLLEPLMPDEAQSLAEFLECAAHDAGPTVVATVYRAPAARHSPAIGARCSIGPSGVLTTSHEWGDSSLLAEMSEECAFVGDPIGGVRGWTREYEDGALAIAFEVVQPPVHLVICGTGADAATVARLAHDIGWRCTVIGDHALDVPGARARFPHAELAEYLENESARALIGCEHRTAAIVMSHRHDRDRSYLDILLETGVRYIGVLGPRRRTDRMFAELASRPDRIDAGARNRIYGPAGLDIGGEGPEIIALAIVAEVATVMNGRDGRHLRERMSPIHDMIEGGDQRRAFHAPASAEGPTRA